MRIRGKIKKGILYLMLLVLVAAGSKVRLDAGQQVFSLDRASLSDQMIENQTELLGEDMMYSGRTGFSCRCELFFVLFILAILSVLFHPNGNVLLLQGNRHIVRRRYVITFMQKMDGRKKIA